MDNRPLGILDSGLGGLTAVKALRRMVPNENIIYFADSARAPYGTRTKSELRIMTAQNLELVASLGVKAILVACGTATTVSGDIIRKAPIPSFGVIDPAIYYMSKIKNDAPLGIIATKASVNSGVLQAKLSKLRPDCEIISIPCTEFVPLIESGHTSADDELLKKAVSTALEPLKAAGISALLLGCTHYGIISEAIASYLGDGVELVSASECAAEALCRYVRENELACACGEGYLQCYTSGSVQSFETYAAEILESRVSAKHLEPREVSSV